MQYFLGTSSVEPFCVLDLVCACQSVITGEHDQWNLSVWVYQIWCVFVRVDHYCSIWPVELFVGVSDLVCVRENESLLLNMTSGKNLWVFPIWCVCESGSLLVNMTSGKNLWVFQIWCVFMRVDHYCSIWPVETICGCFRSGALLGWTWQEAKPGTVDPLLVRACFIPTLRKNPRIRARTRWTNSTRNSR